ncbi:MAG: hypothetical protein D4R84_09535 [Rhodocyclaceae bacterium]|nr:MAG: hypothetical protein D4R84_09535 [Rhodocyclaceae bacterium]
MFASCPRRCQNGYQQVAAPGAAHGRKENAGQGIAGISRGSRGGGIRPPAGSRRDGRGVGGNVPPAGRGPAGRGAGKPARAER